MADKPFLLQTTPFTKGLIVSLVLASLVAIPVTPLLADGLGGGSSATASQDAVSSAVSDAMTNGVKQVQNSMVQVFDTTVRNAILSKDGGSTVLQTFNPGQLMQDTIAYGFNQAATGLAQEAKQRLGQIVTADVTAKLQAWQQQNCGTSSANDCLPSQAQIETWATDAATQRAQAIAQEMFGTSANEFIAALRDIQNFDVAAYLANGMTDYMKELTQWFIQQKVRIIAEKAMPGVGPAIAWWDSKMQQLAVQKKQLDKYLTEAGLLRDLRAEMAQMGRDFLDETFKGQSIQSIIDMGNINSFRNSAGGMSAEVQAVQAELHQNMLNRTLQQTSVPLAFKNAQLSSLVASSSGTAAAPQPAAPAGWVSSEADKRTSEAKAAFLGMTMEKYPYQDMTSVAGQQALVNWAQSSAKVNLAYDGYMQTLNAEPELEQAMTALEPFSPEKIDQLTPGQAFACGAYVQAVTTRIQMGQTLSKLRSDRLFANMVSWKFSHDTRETLSSLQRSMGVMGGLSAGSN